MHESGPFILPAIRDFVPEKWKPCIMIAIVIVFQLSGGVYLASVAEMVGSLALLHEDIMMAGYASLVGMSLTFALLIVIDLLLAPSHLFEHILMESILGYDALHVNSLNWTAILGTATGALFTYQLFALRKWRYKTMTVIGFACILGYLAISYFTIDYNLPKQAFILPVFLRSFGYVIIAICFLTSLSRVPFQNFFQALTIQSFVSAAFGSALGDSIVGHALQVVTKKNAMLLSAGFDHVNPASYKLPAGALYGALQQHALLISMKELYGWLLMIGLFCLFVFMVKESSLRPKYAIHPKFRTIRRAIKHELREDAE